MRRNTFASDLPSLLLPLAALLVVVAACSSTTVSTAPGAGPDAGSPASPDDAGDTADAAVATDAAPGADAAVGADQACGAIASGDACRACCTTNHTAGAQALLDAVVPCGCAGPAPGAYGQGPCFTDCKTTACSDSPKTPSASCAFCLRYRAAGEGGNMCTPAVDAACTSNECVSFRACSAQCDSKAN